MLAPTVWRDDRGGVERCAGSGGSIWIKTLCLLQAIEPFRAGGPISIRLPAQLDDLDAAINAVQGGAHTIAAHGMVMSYSLAYSNR